LGGGEGRRLSPWKKGKKEGEINPKQAPFHKKKKRKKVNTQTLYAFLRGGKKGGGKMYFYFLI